ncbi:hypothetical protein FAZ19_16320 [Sphingobacterium alkalisoli]|uniref:Uncharacterized protein n=1 Tax=Sphingobacterium alkalisoli TaxID=1874115 RepID=A0A4U0H0U3_9SPHI|nr:hypothetical protein [Sphingobacterium alkalisoli]TJY63832.1 hypothetical protein FAZ19_16320 [Sphingobacterium alkalisoli]GGH24581.1 hypothetical protein GCM10011418_32610 [Sphingobacterium alkalisoli]
MASIICPEDCEQVLPSFKFDNCAPEINNSQIHKVYFAKGNAPAFTDVSLATEWAARLGNDSTNEEHDIRVLTGIGSIPKATPSVVNISGRRKKTTSRAYALTFRVDETNQDNHDAMRNIQCGGIYTIWYETIGGLLFGGNEGKQSSIDAGGSHGEGDDDIINHEYLIEWNGLHDPERVVSPL